MTEGCIGTSFSRRAKATIVDMFLIYTPILYIITYGILGGSAEFQDNSLGQFIAVLVYALIASVLIAWKGQTPGKRAYEIKVVDSGTRETISWFRSFLRFFLFLFSATIVAGVILPFFREDNKTLHDLLTQTCVIDSPNDTKPSEVPENKES